MLENITSVMAKLRGARVMDNMYHGIMENAVLVKVNMTELEVQLFAAREFYAGDKNYLQVIKDEIDDFDPETFFDDMGGSFSFNSVFLYKQELFL